MQNTTKTRTTADAIEELTEAIINESLANQRCDFTGWNITECLSNLVAETKRANDLRERFLNENK